MKNLLSLLKLKKLFFSTSFLFLSLVGFTQTSTFYDFNTPGDLSEFFTRGNTNTTNIIQSTNTGIGSTGAVNVGNVSENQVFTTKQGYSNGGVGSVYEFSTFIKSEYNSGYSAIGFTSVPAQSHISSGNPAVCLGVSVHGGGFIFYNNSTASYGDWQSGGIINASIFDLLNYGSPDKWYKIVLKITAQANSAYHMRLEVWPSDASGNLLYGSASAVQERTFSNTTIANSTVLYSYFGFGGIRVSNFDNYSMSLQGSTVIEQGAPVVVNGTAVLSPILNNSIDIEGSVIDDRGIAVTEKGFVWNISGTPTVSDNKITYGSGLGSFNGTINNLAPGTYYLRAYAINTNGVSYGTERIVIVPTQAGEIFTSVSNLDFNLCPDNNELIKTFTVSATGIGSNISLSAVNDFLYSLDNNNFLSTLTISSVSGQVNPTTVYVKFINNNSTSNGILTLSATNALGRSVNLDGSVLSTSINSQPTVTNETVCINATPQTISIAANDPSAIQWYQNSSNTVTGATLINGATSSSYILPTNNPGTIYYFARVTFGDCGSFDSSIVSQTVTPTLNYISSITGDRNLSSVATDATYSVLPVSGATSYVWDLPSGLTLISQTGPSITVGVSSTFISGSISVYALNGCSQTSSRTISVRKAEVPVGGVSFLVTGAPILCSDATATYTATLLTGGSYVWEVPNGITITSGQGTNAINVASDANFTFGLIRAKFITSSYTLDGSYTVSGVAQPSMMSGPVDLCGLTTVTYSVTQVSGVSYVWSVPSGMTIIGSSDSSSINVSITGNVSGNVSVRAQNACGLSTARSLYVKSTPIMGWISGATRVCGAVQATVDTNGAIIDNTPSDTYTYSVVASEGVSYFWTVPSAATIISGQNTNSITVSYDLANFDSGSITVQGTNSCGVGSSRSLNVSAVTGSISGPTSLCSLTTATYNVPSDLGTSFSWSLPEGMSISSGQGTSSITVFITHPVKFNTDNQVRVQFTTGCGGTRTLSLGIGCSDYTNLTSDYCGATSIDPYQWIYATEISAASEYRFNVYDAAGSTLLFSVDRNVPYFRFYGNEFTYGLTYQVKVQVKPRLGVFGVEGSSCSVTLQDVPIAALQASHCGSTVDPYQWLFSSHVAGATEYRFNVYDATGLTLLFSVDRNVNNFRFFGNEFTYGSTYQVKVQAKQGEVYGDEGTACSVTIQGLPTSSINASHCGSTVTPYQWIFTSQVAGATEYRFTIYDATGTNLLFTIDSSVSYFRFLGSAFSYGTTYQVRVQSKQGEVYSAEGTSCSITLSGMPTTSLNASHCGSIVTPNQWMFASQVAGATEYRFNIYDSTGTNLLFSIDRNVAYFRFFGSSFIAGTTYSVGVQAKQGLVYGTEGSRCAITLSGPPTTAIESAQCGTSILYTDAIYAVSVSDATGYKFNVYNQAGTTLVTSFESATNSFSFSQLTGYTFDTTYQVRVQVIRGTEYGVEGTACSITVLKDAPARALSNQDEIKTSMISEFKAYPNPFTTTFSITPMEGETATLFYQVYDVTGKMIESQSVEASNVEYHTIGDLYPAGMYLVIVRQGATTQTFKMVKQ